MTRITHYLRSRLRLRVAASRRVSAVSANDLSAGAATPGVVREIAFDTERATLMRARADGGAASGWHHHGDRDVLGYVVRGRARFEFGADGEESTEVEEGGFFHVPAGLVHRDVNPLDEPQEIILAVVGEGPLVVNLDGPA
jgi:quercetin dioxygenase-like cupin family protein